MACQRRVVEMQFFCRTAQEMSENRPEHSAKEDETMTVAIQHEPVRSVLLVS